MPFTCLIKVIDKGKRPDSPMYFNENRNKYFYNPQEATEYDNFKIASEVILPDNSLKMFTEGNYEIQIVNAETEISAWRDENE